jgi:NitT/TauT family transport system permease protein
LWKDILIPAALPSFITGSITGVGGGWSVLMVAEYFQTLNGTVITRGSNGIGELIDSAAAYSSPAHPNGDLTLLTLSLISMVVLVVGVNRLFWKRAYRMAISRYTYRK